MNLPTLSVQRPILISMVFLFLIVIGLISLLQLPIELYPNISLRNISIVIYVRGGIPPTEVEERVTKLVEESVSTVSHLEEMLAISKEGESTVILSFEPETDMNFAALEVREKFARVKNKLPKEIEKPVIAQFKRSDFPITIMAVSSSMRTTEQLRKIVDESIKERFKRVTGVANVEVSGGRERKILCELDQDKLAEYGISIEKVINALSLNNLNLLSGDIEQKKDKFLVRIIGEFETIDDIKNIAVASSPSGAVLRLKEIGRIEDSYLEPTSYARINVKPIVSLYIQKESTANTIEVADKILQEKKRIEDFLPKDISILTTSDQSLFIKKSIKNLNGSLFQGAILIIIVLFAFLTKLSKKLVGLLILFLFVTMFAPQFMLPIFLTIAIIYLLFRKRLRSILVVVLSIPISVIMTFACMKFINLTLNFMTLFGIALGVGMLVDNSIVVYENTLKKIEEEKEKIKDACINGTSEVLIAIVASTFTTVIVFVPMIFLGREIKLLYSGVAWTVTFSLLVSLLVALSIVPMLLTKVEITKGGGWIDKFTRSYKKLLIKSMRNAKIMFIIICILAAVSFFHLSKMGKSFLGVTEQNKFTIFVELPTGAHLDATDKIVKDVEKIVKDIPEVKTFSSRVEPWSSKVYVEVVPPSKRKRNIGEIIEAIRPKTDKIKPAFIYFEEEQEVGTKEIILDVFGHDYSILRQLSMAMASRLQGIKGFTDVKIRMREGRPEMAVLVDKQKAAILGLTVADIANMIHARLRGLRATLFHTQSSEVETIARLDEKDRKTFTNLHKLVLNPVNSNDPIYLDQVSSFKYQLGPSEIWRKNKERMVQVSANIGSYPLSKAAEITKASLREVNFPKDYFYRLGGDYTTMLATAKQFSIMIVIVLILVYLVLASLFESYTQPFIIMFSVIQAVIGAVLALLFVSRSINMGVFIGFMMLAGIVVNNSIIMVDHFNFLRSKKIPKIHAVIKGSADRLRPILMTTGTTVLGLLPMALDRTEGANLWAPLASTVIGGLTCSTILTLLMTPSLYLAIVREPHPNKTLLTKLTAGFRFFGAFFKK